MTVENISLLNLHERMLPTRRGSDPQPPDHQLDAHPTEPPRPTAYFGAKYNNKDYVVSDQDQHCLSSNSFGQINSWYNGPVKFRTFMITKGVSILLVNTISFVGLLQVHTLILNPFTSNGLFGPVCFQ